MRWANHVARMRYKYYNILVAKREEKSPSTRPRRKWENDVRMDLREVGWESVDWVNLA